MSDCSTSAFKAPEKPELLPCPFCGGKPTRFTWKQNLDEDSYCVIYGCTKKDHTIQVSGDSDLKAIELWNTRYEPTCTYEEIEKQYYRCTNCGYEVHYYEYPPDEGEFCKGCGARVEVVD